MSWKLLVLAAVSLLPLSARGAEMPKEGADSFTNVWVVTSSNTLKLGGDSIYTLELDGAQKSDSGRGAFDSLGGHCLLIDEIIGGNESGHGACTKTDKDGDQLFELVQFKGGGVGSAMLAGGTGKFAGITGSGEYTSQFVKSTDGRGLFVVATKVRWKLP